MLERFQFLDGHDHVAIPQEVENRHCQADADIFAYECCDLTESLQSNCDTLVTYVEQQRILAGAEHINLHLTMGTKAGRYEAANVKEYQANRKNRDPRQQERVWALRDFMANMATNLVTPYAWKDREADDGMAQFQLARIKQFGIESSIIMTKDKDLRMIAGKHMHPETLEVNTASGYGKCELVDGSSKQVKGWGTSFFWHQMLMGDTADNIPGLPKLSGELANKYCPTAKHNPRRKAISCGPVAAFKVLDGITNDRDAFCRVWECYQGFYTDELLTRWDGTVIPYSAGQAFYEQAYLLWMQRVPNEDVKEFFKEIFQ